MSVRYAPSVPSRLPVYVQLAACPSTLTGSGMMPGSLSHSLPVRRLRIENNVGLPAHMPICADVSPLDTSNRMPSSRACVTDVSQRATSCSSANSTALTGKVPYSVSVKSCEKVPLCTGSVTVLSPQDSQTASPPRQLPVTLTRPSVINLPVTGAVSRISGYTGTSSLLRYRVGSPHTPQSELYPSPPLSTRRISCFMP